MTILYELYYPFENLIFTRNGNNLLITDIVDAGFYNITEPNFFLNPTLHLTDGIRAFDENGNMQSYFFNNQIRINVSATNQWFEGTDYNELITADGSTVLTGGGGNDTFYSRSGSFSQTFQGDAGNDTYYSGPGTDTFIGGIGFDTYVFCKNDGNDGIIDYNPGDYIRFTDVTWDELTFTSSDNNLHITYGDSSVTVNHFFNADGSIQVNALDTIITAESGEAHDIKTEADIHTTFFTNKYFNNLKFTRVGDDLTISTLDDIELVTYEDFFNGGAQIETVTAPDDEGQYRTFNILTDAEIHINPTTATYIGTDYNEIITATETMTNITGGGGNDTVISASTSNNPLTVTGNTGNDTFISGAGEDTFIFNIGDGNDILNNSDIKDILRFNDATLEDMTFVHEALSTSLTIKYKDDQLTITDYYDEDGFVKDNAIDVFYAAGSTEAYSIQENAFWGNTYRASDAVNGKITGTNDDDRVLGSDYVSKSDKGLTITTYAGNDYILGTNYNDTINSSAGNNVVKEVVGKNKITTGSGNDTVILAGYSINTVNAGTGNNVINVKSAGTNKISTGKNNDTLNLYNGNNTANLGAGDNKVNVNALCVNKVTCGTGVDTINVNAGLNTINAGHGNNVFTVTNGINTLSSGNHYDTYHIYGGNNTIRSGYGNDEFYIYSDFAGTPVDGGYNDISSGEGNDKFVVNAGNNIIKTGNGANHVTVNAGINYITAGSGSDTFILTGGNNSVVGGAGNDIYVTNRSASFVDSKGNDLYNLSAIADYNNVLVSISDYNGYNAYEFSEDILDKDVLFSVKITSKPKIDEFGNCAYTLGKDVAFTTYDEHGKYTTGVDITGLANISDVTVGNTLYIFDVSEVAQEVANWLHENHFTSTDTVLAKGSEGDVAALLAIYNAHDVQDYLYLPNA